MSVGDSNGFLSEVSMDESTDENEKSVMSCWSSRKTLSSMVSAVERVERELKNCFFKIILSSNIDVSHFLGGKIYLLAYF